MDAPTNSEETVREWIKAELVDVLDDEKTFIQITDESNIELLHMATLQTPTGMIKEPETLIEISHPFLDAEITLHGSIEMNAFEDDTDELTDADQTTLRLDVEDVSDGHQCPCCLYEFDRSKWTDEGV